MDAELVEHIKADIGFFLPDWRVEFKRLKAYYGWTHQDTKTIDINTYLVETGTIANIRDTVLHEVAHGLVGPNHGHDSVWQEMAKSLGARPTAKGDGPKAIIPHKFELRCFNHPDNTTALSRKGKWYRWGMKGIATCRKCNGKMELWDVERNVKLN